WLEALAGRCRAAGAAALFALTYDGRFECRPAEREDDDIRALMNRHQQRSDKGFGAAAEPDAAVYAERAFAAAGYYVQRERSDWILDPDARDLQHQLIEGWSRAAGAVAPEQSAMIARRAIARPDSVRLFSLASAWELTIKSSLGKLRLPLSAGKFLEEHLPVNRIELLPITFGELTRVEVLPFHHRDPFDRMIAAQAL